MLMWGWQRRYVHVRGRVGGVSIVGFRASNHPQQTSRRGVRDETDDRRTPPDLLSECASCAHVGGFDLDVAASSENAKAERFYTVDDDGRTQPWFGRVWCNPPYSDIAPWVERAHRERSNPDVQVTVMLLPANRTEQRWWQTWIEPHRTSGVETHFLAGRRRFDRPGWTKPAKGDRPPFGLCVVVFLPC